MALSIFVFRAIALTFFVMLATLVMADVEVVLVVVAPCAYFRHRRPGMAHCDSDCRLIGPRGPDHVAVQLSINPRKSGKSAKGLTMPVDSKVSIIVRSPSGTRRALSESAL